MTNKDVGIRSARRLEDIHLPTAKTKWLSNAFFLKAGQEWNQLPPSIRASSSLFQFKRLINQFYTVT